jgi:hypothetical protein
MTFDQPPERVLDVLAENVVGITGASSCAIIIMDPPGQRVELAGTHNLAAGYIDAVEAIWSSGAYSPRSSRFDRRRCKSSPTSQH